MLCKVMCGTICGIDVIPITIEVDVTPGIAFYLVGLPGNAVKESQQRISSSLQKIGFKIPGKKIIINLAPADIRKDGSSFDVPIAIAILAASEQICINNVSNYFIAGELALDGSLRPVKGALPLILHAKESNYKGIILPTESAYEGVEIEGINIYGANTIKDVINILNTPDKSSSFIIQNRKDLSGEILSNSKSDISSNIKITGYDFRDIKGQNFAKKGLEIAAAGSHNLIMTGSPGSGKTFLAKSLMSILPPLSREESIQTSIIYSIAGELNPHSGLIKERPFRQPHHTSTLQALTGGGSKVLPGEISLAHCGVLFLDEIAEFSRPALEVLRQPLEDRIIQISRVHSKISYPASFMLIAAMNPCPCGYYGDANGKCCCTSSQIQKYEGKISGPLLDRIDLHIRVSPLSFNEMTGSSKCEGSSEIRQRVINARKRQEERFKEYPNIFCNAQMTSHLIHKYAVPDKKCLKIMQTAMERLGLSARAYDRILKVALTIADLEGCSQIEPRHIAEAISYRNLV